MSVSAEKLEGNKAKLTIEVPEETFEKSMDKAFRQVAKKISVHGFRKGKAPRQIVERTFGREILLEDAINDVVPEAFRMAIEELGHPYECIVYPQYDVVSSEKGEGLVFTATYDMKPEITLGPYKGMELVKLSVTVEDDAVEKQLKAMQERFARLEKTEEAAVKGDVCTIDFLGMVDDVPFEGGEGKDYQLELGSGTFIPGFEEQLEGAKAGDELKLNVVFPENYQTEELAGKDAVFSVTLKEVQHKILSEMDDEFAKDVSEFETLEELKKDIDEKLHAEANRSIQSDFETKAVEKVIQDVELTLPDSMVAFRQDQLVDNFAHQIAMQGLSIEAYMQYANMDAEALRGNFKERAIQELQTELVLEAIAKAEGIVASDEDVSEEYRKLADQTGRPVEEIEKLYSENKTMLESLKQSLIMNKTIQFLTDSAIVSTDSAIDTTDSAIVSEEKGEENDGN
ncbi:MAG: trigger factor [Clostridiales bacterium]|nr:trigger factor [Clostridiales bacterium]